MHSTIATLGALPPRGHVSVPSCRDPPPITGFVLEKSASSLTGIFFSQLLHGGGGVARATKGGGSKTGRVSCWERGWIPLVAVS